MYNNSLYNKKDKKYDTFLLLGDCTRKYTSKHKMKHALKQ